MSVLSNEGKRTRLSFVWLGCCLLVSLVTLLYPFYVLRPFRYQGPHELAVALAVLRIGPWLQIALVALAVVVTVWSWRAYRSVGQRTLAIGLMFLIVVCGIASRINIFERLFHPLERPVFVAAADSKLDGAEMVIAVNIRGAARAYPIRIISYHHIVNDVAGGVPIVATY